MNNKGEKTKSSWKNIVIFILTVTIIILIISGVFSYINYANKKENHKDVPPTEETYSKLDINDDLVEELFSVTRNGRNNFFNTKYENIYYNSEIIETKELDINFKLLLSFLTLDDDKFSNDGEKVIIKEKDLKDQYIRIFGNDSYEAQDIEYNCPSIISYNEEEKTYEYDEACGGMSNSGYKNKLVEARKYDDKIEIYEKAIFYLIDEATENVTYWKNSNYTDFITEASMDEEVNVDNYLESLNTYKYTFAKNGDNYTFEKVELVK